MSNTAQRAKQAQYMGTIDDLLRALDATAVKSAETLSEPGSIGGSTTHPVANVDDRLQKATEGSRSSENSEDAKEDQPTAGVDSTSEGTPGGQDSVQMDVGITSKSTGEDPAAETDKAKGGKEDPGSSHPARTDNDELDGSKYSSTYDFFDALCKQAQAAGNDMLATISVEAGNAKKAAAKPATAPAAKSAATVEPEAPVADAQPELDKQAVDALVINSLAETIASAEDRAVKTAEYLASYITARKQAEDEEVAEPAPEGDAGAVDAGAAPAGGGEDPMAAMAGGGGGAPAGDPGAGAGPSEEDLAMLAQILQETGMTPEDLIQLIAGAAGGGGGGGAPGGGGDPMAAMAGGGGAPAGPDPAAMGGAAGGAPPADPMAGNKIASAKRTKWQAKTAADRAKYAKVKSHLVELMSANKR